VALFEPFSAADDETGPSPAASSSTGILAEREPEVHLEGKAFQSKPRATRWLAMKDEIILPAV
jgi:hypothetical protein